VLLGGRRPQRGLGRAGGGLGVQRGRGLRSEARPRRVPRVQGRGRRLLGRGRDGLLLRLGRGSGRDRDEVLGLLRRIGRGLARRLGPVELRGRLDVHPAALAQREAAVGGQGGGQVDLLGHPEVGADLLDRHAEPRLADLVEQAGQALRRRVVGRARPRDGRDREAAVLEGPHVELVVDGEPVGAVELPEPRDGPGRGEGELELGPRLRVDGLQRALREEPDHGLRQRHGAAA